MNAINVFRLIQMLLRESTAATPTLQRRPEPTQLMDELSQVEAFHDLGGTQLIPVYHFNAMATSGLVPGGGTVIDLGSGSGQYLAYLAERRPDLRIIGIELAPTMVEFGQEFLKSRGLSDRVELRVGDMTTFAGAIDSSVSLVSSVFSLHHLPGSEDLTACLNQIHEVRERTGCGVWIFDHARPRHPKTPEVFPELFTPSAPATFNNDSRNSLIAAYSFDELKTQLETAGLGSGDHWLSRWMRLYQVHRLPSVSDPEKTQFTWRETPLTANAQRDLAGLQRLFPECPA